MSDFLLFQNICGLSVRMFLERFHISKKLIYKLEQEKALIVNQEPVKADYVLKNQDKLMIVLDEFEKESLQPSKGPLKINYEDEDLLLVYKSPGILVHPDGNEKMTLDNIIAGYFLRNGITRTVRHAYRLDYDASGLLLYTKHFLAASHINYQIENNILRKKYYAVVEGRMEKDGLIDLKIGKDRHRNNRYIVSKTGKSAQTKYRVIKSGKKRSLLEVEIITGRRHQIRVHFSHIGHPLVGDSYYGKQGKRFLLEAYYISFIHPRTGEFKEFVLPLPDDFKI